MVEFGPDFGYVETKWSSGVRANNGWIYSTPYDAKCILIIRSISDMVEELDIDLPERGLHGDYGIQELLPQIISK